MVGRIIVMTGDGKGKTTSAIGLGFVSALTGKQVRAVQFLKGGGYTGEIFASERFGKSFQILQFGKQPENHEEIAAGAEKSRALFGENRKAEYAQEAFAQGIKWANDEAVDVLILDEVSHSINRGLIELSAITDLLQSKRSELTVILTGRRMPVEIIALADEATEAFPERHPMKKGIGARWGIEY